MQKIRIVNFNLKRLLIFIVVILTIVVGGYLLNISRTNKELGTKMTTLKMAFPYSQSISEYEPTNIQLAPQYALLENLFSPLIELSSNGDIRSGVAQRFEWYDNELHFEIRQNLKTIDGIEITAKDVEFSLKRLLVLTGNTHGNLKDILCPNVNLKSVEDVCPNLEIRNDFLIVFRPPEKDVFLVKMLTAIDFSIIPKSSVDLKTLKIIDYRNTTGPYFVEHNDEHGKIILAANPNHFHYSQKMPQKVELVPSSQSLPDSSLEDFKIGKVDFITEADSTKSEKIIDFSREFQDSVLHSTINIRMFVLNFTEQGMQKLSAQKRFLIGKSMKIVFRNLLLGKGLYQTSDQVFPVFGEGSINPDEIKILDEVYQKANNDEKFDGSGLKLGFIRMGDISNFTEKIKIEFPKLEMLEIKSHPIFQTNQQNDDAPDMVIAGPDTGFLEDIGLITYSLNAGVLGLSKKDVAPWLKTYMETTDKNERIKKLQKLHFEALMSPSVVPLVASPYVALVRKPWKLGLPKYFANNALWLVERE
jgi:hypothetical protein